MRRLYTRTGVWQFIDRQRKRELADRRKAALDRARQEEAKEAQARIRRETFAAAFDGFGYGRPRKASRVA